MLYQVLARKWRPKNFSEVVGQGHIIRALTNALNQQRLHHAYLFSGTRGVGKTTIARILAKCFNCETGITATPCCCCDTCTEIDTGRLIDLIEVDAASRTKVEDTRDLLDNVQYLPTKSRYKIYIIDEVHMLSGHSFNALLKTLEEPPEHVKFLLATTDPQKLPITVLSRCLQFNLKALSPELIQKQLKHILIQEKITFEDQALYQLALNANGSVRDSLSLLDQAISFGNNQVITSDVKIMLSAIDTSKVLALLAALVANNADKILTIIAELAELAVDFPSVIDELLEILHQITIVQLAPTTNTEHWQYPKPIRQLATQLSPEEVQLYYQIGLIGKRDLFLAPSPKSGCEMIMLRMLAFRPDTTAATLATKNPPSSIKPSLNSNANCTNLITPTINNAAINGQHPNKIAELEQSDPSSAVFALRAQSSIATNAQQSCKLTCAGDILSQLEVSGPTQALLQHCIVAKITTNEAELMLDPSQSPLLNKKQEERIAAAFSKYCNSPMNVTIKLGTSNMDTLANTKKLEATQKHQQATQAIAQDHNIKELLTKFDAKIITNSVNSLADKP